jgi:hypothetical protein
VRAVDDVVLARLAALDGFDVHDGVLELDDSDGNLKIVTYDLPYAVYTSSIGDDDKPRLTGRRARRSVFFSVLYVGIDRNQAKACGERIRESLQDKSIPVPGHQVWLCQLQESQRIRRDDEAVRPDGSPLYYGVDNYALPITIVHTA